MLHSFGIGNDWWILRFFGCRVTRSHNVFNDNNGLIMREFDKVEKTKKSITDADIFWEYTKIFLFFLAGMAYAYFIILGKTL